MSNIVVYLAIGFLVIANIVAFVLFLIFNSQRSDCQNNQSPFCPQVLCSQIPPGTKTAAAFRIDKNGNKVYSS